jgi:hypothetical protein
MGSGNVSVYTKKYYRVVLEGFDQKRENADSFAIKLSIRTRTPLPRVRHVLRRLPRTIRSGLSQEQANRLKAVLESIGGVARLEAHFVTPGQSEELKPRPLVVKDHVENVIVCPECGWEEEEGVTYCSLCLRKFRDDEQHADTLASRVPDRNPLVHERAPADDESPVVPLPFWARYRAWIIIGAGLLVAIILLIK